MKEDNQRGALVECGKVGRPHGLKGEVAVFWNSGRSPVKVGDEVFGGRNSKNIAPYKISALRKQGRFCVARFEGVGDRSKAAALRGLKLFVSKDALEKLPHGEYYTYEIIGLDVYTEEGELLGKVEKIFAVGGHDVYEVKKGKKEILIPAVDHVVLKIDLNAKKITVRLLDGMID